MPPSQVKHVSRRPVITGCVDVDDDIFAIPP